VKSSTTKKFRDLLAGLTPQVQAQARKSYRLWLRDSRHPSLHFKKVGTYWSVRVDRDHRALGLEKGGTIYWAWIGPHVDYERLLRGR
jgi:hypothetical protein